MRTQNSNLWQNQSSHFSQYFRIEYITKQSKYRNILKSYPAAASMSM